MTALRLICPGATAAGVASTLLIAGGATFTATPLGDGRWLLEAETSAATASLVTIRLGEPVVLEAGEPPPAPAGQAPAAPPDVVDRTGITAGSVATAKAAAIRVAKKEFGAIPYPGEPWASEGNLFTRAAYRGKRTGAIVIGAAAEGDWWVGWRPRQG